uniref:NADH dehydrogenase [ubiquinone] 1 alpha subcomplex subunit 11 n=1 Tax=Spermophilus dauricus TaxID=99837 RepID=A0A8C9PGH1_SPEDA
AGHFLFSHTPVIRDTPQCHCCLVEETKIDWPPSLCPTGLIWSAYSVTHRPPDSVLEGVARAGRYTFTAASLGAVFGITSCFSAQVRGKPDDPLNYFLGGCAGGLTLGARSEYPARPAPWHRTPAPADAILSSDLDKSPGSRVCRTLPGHREVTTETPLVLGQPAVIDAAAQAPLASHGVHSTRRSPQGLTPPAPTPASLHPLLQPHSLLTVPPTHKVQSCPRAFAQLHSAWNVIPPRC